jgi:(p)ppGpp synthase/HD superfamily hydrolase
MSEESDYYLEQVLEFAYEKHKDQKRKYTNEPYINHPINVATIIEDAFSHTPELYIYSDKLPVRINTVIGAWLHDVVEDTNTSFVEIEEKFGIHIRNILYYVTNISKPTDGNRKIRKKIDMIHNFQGPVESIMIKLADIIDNCNGIMKRDPEFGKKYLKEKQHFLSKILTDNHYFKFRNTLDKPLFDVFEYLYIKARTVIDNEEKMENEINSNI